MRVAELKRLLTTGTTITITGWYEAAISDTWEGGDLSQATHGPLLPRPVAGRLAQSRVVESTNSVGFVAGGSHCEWPRANELHEFPGGFAIMHYDSHGAPVQRREYKIG